VRGENIVSFNFTNLITISIMGAVGFFVLGLISQFFHASTGSSDEASS